MGSATFLHVKQLHLIWGVGDGVAVAYAPTNGFIVELQKGLAEAVRLYQQEGCFHCEGMSSDDVREALEKLEAQLCFASQRMEETGHCDADKSVLNRVTLHVSNDCNLNCSYCYALGGDYGHARGLMTRQTAVDVVNFLCLQFDRVEHVVFFGGEPMLNIPVIETVCAQFKEAYDRGQIEAIPKFGIITNGTILNDKVVCLIRDHIDFITVSLDGPKEIHDFNRRKRDGQGSYDDVNRFIRRIQSETDVKVRFEGTVSKEHRRRRISGRDLYDFAYSTYGIYGSVATDILADDRRHVIQEDSEDWHTERTILGIPESQFYDTGVDQLLPGLVHNVYREMCPVGENIVSIDIHGDLYACHITVGTKRLSLGSIYGDNVFTSRNRYEERFPFLRVVRKNHQKCQQCWMRRLCGGCAIRWFFDISEMNFLGEPKQGMCEAQGEEFEKIIAELVKAKKDPQAWDALKTVLQTVGQLEC